MIEIVLGCSSSIAVVAVAYSVLIRDLAIIETELDPFLAHPEIWHLEIERVVTEDEGLAYRTAEEVPGRRMQPQQVAMELVLRGDAARRQRLAELGRAMVAAYEARQPTRREGDEEDLGLHQVRRFAAFLDIDTYVAREVEDGVLIEAAVPDEMQAPLEESVARARHGLEVASLASKAVAALNGETVDLDIDQLVRRAKELQDEAAQLGEPPIGVTSFDLSTAASAAAIALDRLDADEDYCVNVLLAAASRLPEPVEPFGIVRESRWSLGADRSAARALPVLIRLRGQERRIDEPIRAAALVLSANPHMEVRRYFSDGLAALLTAECDNDIHGLALECLRVLLGWSGLGPWTDGRRDFVRLPEPLEEQIRRPDTAMSMTIASDVIAALDRAARVPCAHRTEAAGFLNALIDRDLLIRPGLVDNERRETLEASDELEAVVGRRVVEGDAELLDRYFNAFAQAPEALAGVVAAITSAGQDEASWQRIVSIWEGMDRLLAPPRRDGRGRYRDDEELAKALLPVPRGFVPQVQTLAPLRGWVDLWTARFSGRSDLVDSLLALFGAQGRGPESAEVEAVRLLIGNHLDRAIRGSQLLVPWLAQPLEQGDPARTGDAFRQARDLMDELAAAGHAEAIRVQRELES